MITVRQVTKKYGKFIANQNIDMEAKSGELTVLLGPNGAGKSTLIKCICGLLRFEGEIMIEGNENHSMEAKRILGYVPETPAIYNMLTIYEHLEFIAKAYKLTQWTSRADELLKRFELSDKRNKLGKELSKGMQQKVSICCALLPDPAAVIFDEPFVGLDPHAIRELKHLLSDLKNSGKSLIISTHIIDSMEDTWDTTYIMKEGKILETVRRTELSDTKKLEEIFFEKTEGDAHE